MSGVDRHCVINSRMEVGVDLVVPSVLGGDRQQVTSLWLGERLVDPEASEQWLFGGVHAPEPDAALGRGSRQILGQGTRTGQAPPHQLAKSHPEGTLEKVVASRVLGRDSSIERDVLLRQQLLSSIG